MVPGAINGDRAIMCLRTQKQSTTVHRNPIDTPFHLQRSFLFLAPGGVDLFIFTPDRVAAEQKRQRE